METDPQGIARGVAAAVDKDWVDCQLRRIDATQQRGKTGKVPVFYFTAAMQIITSLSTTCEAICGLF
jgi:hypothetical protein